ncbi:MAG: proteasome regulatory particle subunit [Watsoniomyces obsoletus]|nr:MAG: proteasome regulatory particle subunit [Watsoniomyces obsoletus]
MRTGVLSYFAVWMALIYSVIGVEMKSIMVTYPNEVPDSVIAEAREAVLAKGGIITHDYEDLLRGFAANVPIDALDVMKTAEDNHGATVEEDQMVSINT